MSTGVKLCKAQISKIIQSGGSFGFWLGNLEKKAITNIAIPLTRDNLPGLVGHLTSNAINANMSERKITGKEAVRVVKGFTLSISSEDVNNIIEIIKSSQDLGVLINGVAETEKHEIKKQEGRYFGQMVQPVLSSLIKCLTEELEVQEEDSWIETLTSAPSFLIISRLLIIWIWT